MGKRTETRKRKKIQYDDGGESGCSIGIFTLILLIALFSSASISVSGKGCDFNPHAPAPTGNP